MKPQFVEEEFWEIIPEEIRERIVPEGASLLRKGYEIEEAFWEVFHKLVDPHLAEYFRVDATLNLLNWPLVAHPDGKTRAVAYDILAKHFRQHTDIEKLRELKQKNEVLYDHIEAPCPFDGCLYCGMNFEYEKQARLRPEVHVGCEAEFEKTLRNLTRIVWSKAVFPERQRLREKDRLELEASVDLGPHPDYLAMLDMV